MKNLHQHLHGHAAEQPAAETAHTHGLTIGWAKHYDLVVGLLSLGRERRLREATLDLAQVQPGDHVLDVGCGTGSLTLYAKKRTGASG
ncbi:MAG: hypothetical protein EHM70_21270, partial [Chloroflexota bacterium]